MVSNASEIQAELERILLTRWLRESHQLSALLRYVVEETIEGRSDGLKEYSLGLQVFHRSPDYDPRNDAIVRVQASLLRKRLSAYYENEGKDSSLRIHLPRGGYIPEFQVVEDRPFPPPSAEPASLSGPPPPSPSRPLRVFVAGLTAGIVAVAAIWAWMASRPKVVPAESPELWSGFLQPGVETVASFGVPLFFSGGQGLYIRDVTVNRLSDDPARVNQVGSILKREFRPQEDIYTGVGDAIGTYYIARWLENHGVPVSVASSNNIGASDIEGKNLVVVSSVRFQTLLHQMNLPDRIPFIPSAASGGFRLPDPLPGEQTDYLPRGSDAGVGTSYAVVSVWPGLPNHRRMMYISGIETWSTQGAAEFVIDPAKILDLHRRMEADPAQGPRGRKGPYFQVLIRVEGKNYRVHSATYVTHRYLEAQTP